MSTPFLRTRCAQTRSPLARVLVAVALAGVVALLICLWHSTAARADVSDLTPPPDGCLASDTAAVMLYETSDVQTATLDLDGPVVQVLIEWSGIWQPAPTDPTIGVEVVGPGGTDSGSFDGTESDDATGLPTMPSSIAYGYHADITDLFGAGQGGAYTVNVTPPIDGIDLPEAAWWGATITAVYDDAPCVAQKTAIWKSGVDYYFGGNSTSSPTTNLIVYDWGYPLAENYTATVHMSQGGADHFATDCRASAIWVATGAGGAPAESDDLVNDVGVPNAALGGVEGIVNPFTPPSQTCPAPALTAPVTSFSGGHLGPQWGMAEFEMTIPAGSTWAAFQLESPADNNTLPGFPETAAWSGGGLLLPAFVPPVPDISLEKTVLDGAGATCPGVEGTDELVTGEVGDPVTYCFKTTNTGEVGLSPVDLDDPDLAITDAEMTLVSGDDTVPVAPGDELVYAYDSTITASLLNSATVTGYSVDNQAPVTDTNDAAVTARTVPTDPPVVHPDPADPSVSAALPDTGSGIVGYRLGLAAALLAAGVLLVLIARRRGVADVTR